MLTSSHRCSQCNSIRKVSWKSWPNPVQSNPCMDPIPVQPWSVAGSGSDVQDCSDHQKRGRVHVNSESIWLMLTSSGKLNPAVDHFLFICFASSLPRESVYKRLLWHDFSTAIFMFAVSFMFYAYVHFIAWFAVYILTLCAIKGWPRENKRYYETLVNCETTAKKQNKWAENLQKKN